MKTILCYGDSLTWGYIPGDLGRYSREERWPFVLQQQLGTDYHVVEEGLSGRYTVFDEPYRQGRNGAALLRPILETHSPLDLLIVLLGTNDVLHQPSVSAFDAARGIEVLIGIAATSGAGPRGSAPQILIVSPPTMTALSSELRKWCHGDPSESAQFAEAFAEVATAKGAHFLDAAAICTVSPVDGVHLDANGQRLLGLGIAHKVRDLNNNLREERNHA